MYAIRLRRQGGCPTPVELITDKDNLYQLCSVLQHSPDVVRFQVWQSVRGQMSCRDLGFSFTKLTSEGLW